MANLLEVVWGATTREWTATPPPGHRSNPPHARVLVNACVHARKKGESVCVMRDARGSHGRWRLTPPAPLAVVLIGEGSR